MRDTHCFMTKLLHRPSIRHTAIRWLNVLLIVMLLAGMLPPLTTGAAPLLVSEARPTSQSNIITRFWDFATGMEGWSPQVGGGSVTYDWSSLHGGSLHSRHVKSSSQRASSINWSFNPRKELGEHWVTTATSYFRAHLYTSKQHCVGAYVFVYFKDGTPEAWNYADINNWTNGAWLTVNFGQHAGKEIDRIEINQHSGHVA